MLAAVVVINIDSLSYTPWNEPNIELGPIPQELQDILLQPPFAVMIQFEVKIPDQLRQDQPHFCIC